MSASTPKRVRDWNCLLSDGAAAGSRCPSITLSAPEQRSGRAFDRRLDLVQRKGGKLQPLDKPPCHFHQSCGSLRLLRRAVVLFQAGNRRSLRPTGRTVVDEAERPCPDDFSFQWGSRG